MVVVPGVDALDPAHGRLLFAVGVFDGLHRGHLYLLERLRAGAQRRGARPGVITFDAHPDEVLLGSAPPLLLDPQDRLERLAAAGVAVTVVQHFDAALRATSYREFVARIADRVDLAGFVMTPDAAFGHQRAGTPEALARLGDELGFDVEVVPVLSAASGPIRSSAIRAAIAAGEFGRAAELLGREVSIVGRAAGAAPGGGTALRFDLPVVLPPDGAFRVIIDADSESPPLRRRLLVSAGSARLEPAVGVPDGVRIRVRLPSAVATATIRRS
jgi:riboflavin kinase/FMN adenylyltransferase